MNNRKLLNKSYLPCMFTQELVPLCNNHSSPVAKSFGTGPQLQQFLSLPFSIFKQ